MSIIMDRNEILSLTRKISSGYLGTEDMFRVTVDYCIEKGKDVLMSQQFVMILLRSGKIMKPFSTALEYFQKKFGICTLTDAKGKVITIF